MVICSKKDIFGVVLVVTISTLLATNAWAENSASAVMRGGFFISSDGVE